MYNFVIDCINGDALLEEIDDYILKWHESDCQNEVYEYLGMTQQEYLLWVEEDSILKYIIIAHERNINIDEVLNEYTDARLVARSSNANDAKKIYDWLKKKGKIQ